jgi:hypothetical protein
MVWSLHGPFYQFTKIILCAVPAKWQRRCRSTSFYPITSKYNRYCGKVFSEITKIHYTSRLEKKEPRNQITKSK